MAPKQELPELAVSISVMLPPMAIFFPLFTMLEDFGSHTLRYPAVHDSPRPDYIVCSSSLIWKG